MSLQEELLNDGVSHGMCQKFQDEWGDPSYADLASKYFKGQDFCIEHDWPALDWCEKNLQGHLWQYGIFISETGSVLARNNASRNIALLGNSDVDIEVQNMCDITVRHDSVLHLKALAGSFVYVSLHNNCKLHIVCKEPGARICVSHFGGEIINSSLIDKYHKK